MKKILIIILFLVVTQLFSQEFNIVKTQRMVQVAPCLAFNRLWRFNGNLTQADKPEPAELILFVTKEGFRNERVKCLLLK